jgi:hypothetical protein
MPFRLVAYHVSSGTPPKYAGAQKLWHGKQLKPVMISPSCVGLKWGICKDPPSNQMTLGQLAPLSGEAQIPLSWLPK